MLPSMIKNNLLNDSLFEDIMNLPFREDRYHLMRTDIKKLDDSYELSIDMPGVKKEDIKAELKDGYLIISASISSDKESEEGYIRRERYRGTSKRSFYIGNNVSIENISAEYIDGILKINIPINEPKENKQLIEIK